MDADGSYQEFLSDVYYFDGDFLKQYDINVIAGRGFNPQITLDESAMLINETMVKKMGYKTPGEAIGKQFKQFIVGGTIVGVVKDFNFSSMHQNVGPLIIQLSLNYGSMAVRVNTKNVSSVIDNIKTKWTAMAPAAPFSYTFMDADFNKVYDAEQRTGKLFITFAIFAIFIGCLGLFGLVTYAAEQRTKEIGVRKVLGASVGSIVAMLSKDFTRLVVIASFIAFPVAWWAMNKWLQSFAYRTSISWWVFVIAGLTGILIALVTVSIQALKAAVINPVKSLRTE